MRDVPVPEGLRPIVIGLRSTKNKFVFQSPKKEQPFDPKKYGVIVTKGGRRGLLLPDLDGVDTVSQQISIAKQKAGIGKWENVKLSRFTVTRHK